MAKEKRPILITAGGTGGHVYPGLAVARALQDAGIPVVWMGTRAGLEARVIPEAGIPIDWLTITGVRGKSKMTLLLAPLRLQMALFQAIRIFRKHKPKAVLGMGGFVAGPGGVAATLFMKPLLIHEQNAIPGLTNKLLARLSDKVLEGFPGTFSGLSQAMAVGNPVRKDIATLAVPEERLKGRKGAIRVLIVGGSLGAVALNELVPQAMALLPAGKRPMIRHQAGKSKDDSARKTYESLAVEATVTAFIEDMAEAYAWADIVICRSGALTIAELAAVGVASILVPYPFAVDDHQTANGRYLADAGAAVLFNQNELTAEGLATQLQDLERERLLEMAKTARSLAKPDATEHVAKICAEMAGYEFKPKVDNGTLSV